VTQKIHVSTQDIFLELSWGQLALKDSVDH